MGRTILLISLLVVVMLFGIQNIVFAHCDTLEGPVIKDAKAALASKDVTPVLKWVAKEQEGKVKTAFEKALKERVKDKEKADMSFFETLVRIHRQGEGAPFTGIKPAGTTPEPIVTAADEAIEAGMADSLIEEISSGIAQGVHERFHRVLETKQHLDESVEAGREYVAAYVEFVHYLEGIHNLVSGGTIPHHETEDIGRTR